jgi:acyl carrier protein
MSFIQGFRFGVVLQGNCRPYNSGLVQQNRRGAAWRDGDRPEGRRLEIGMASLEDVRQIVGEVLQLGDRTARLARDSALLGSLPEFDSMAVVSVLTALEERLGIVVEDDEITAETFETLGSLYDFVSSKL